MPVDEGETHLLPGVEGAQGRQRQPRLEEGVRLQRAGGQLLPGRYVFGQGRLVAASPSDSLYIQDSPSVAMATQALGASGGSQPHSNLMPYIAINYIISLFGIYPTPN